MKDKNISIKELMAVIAADIDIKLLKELDQETDKDKLFSNVEIREQIIKTMTTLQKVLRDCGINIDKEIEA
jgi:hypothetical protein